MVKPLAQPAGGDAAPAAASLRDVMARLTQSADALAALGVAIQDRLTGGATDGQLTGTAAAVVEAMGLRDQLDREPPAALRALLAEARTFALVDARLLASDVPSGHWLHEAPDLLLSAGEATAGVAQHLRDVVAPRLDGLAERLDRPGAAFLDIGCGVAALSVAAAQAWPGLAVVGLEPLQAARLLASERVQAAGLADRVLVRAQRAEHLTEREAYDLAWLPSLFVPEDAIPEILRRAHAALRRGGWLIMPVVQASADPVTHSVRRFRAASFGGSLAHPSEMERQLRDTGFERTCVLAGAPTALTVLVAGRRRGDPAPVPSGARTPAA